MAKTTNSIPQACQQIEVSDGCDGTWHDISGQVNIYELPEEVVATGSVPVMKSDTHVLGTGPKEPITAVFTIVYTEAVGEAMELAWDTWNTEGCNKLFCVRVTPGGGNVGDKQWYVGENNTTDPAYLAAMTPPNGDASEGTPTIATFSVFGNYTRDTQTS